MNKVEDLSIMIIDISLRLLCALVPEHTHKPTYIQECMHTHGPHIPEKLAKELDDFYILKKNQCYKTENSIPQMFRVCVCLVYI